MGVEQTRRDHLKHLEAHTPNQINNITIFMYSNLYNHFFLKCSKKNKINFWCLGRKLSPTMVNKLVVLPKGIFFRVISVKAKQIGLIAGTLVSTRKPFVRPTKELRR